MDARDATDGQLWQACRKLPSDFEPYGQRKWQRQREGQPDCATCRWFLELFRTWPDWGACANPQSPRAGLLTFWEQGCEQFEQEKGSRDEETRRARCDFKNQVWNILREEAGDFMREEVRKANDPLREEEPPAPKPEDIRESPLFIILRRLLRRADEDSRRQAVDEMAAKARQDSRRYWEFARRYWAGTFGEEVLAISLPERMQELEDELWERVDATVREALEWRAAEPNEEEAQEG
jgi:hypothetical protein